MKLSEIKAVVDELKISALGQKFGRVFVLSRKKMAVDLRYHDSKYLYISAEPSAPGIYLINRKLKELERSSGTPLIFHNLLKKYLSGKTICDLEQIKGERIVIITLIGSNDLGENETWRLVVQLTGRSSNLFILDHESHIFAALRDSKDDVQSVGQQYLPPKRPDSSTSPSQEEFILPSGVTASEYFDDLYLKKEQEQSFRSKASAAESAIKKLIASKQKLIGKLNGDLIQHGDAEKWKKYGDLILANLYTATRIGDEIVVTDYFDEDTPEITIDGDKDSTLSENAEVFFKRYTKARNANEEIAKRIAEAVKERLAAEIRLERIQEAITEKDTDFFDEIVGQKQTTKESRHKNSTSSGVRKFLSSDGFEMLVGKKAKDNDQLTFRIAASLDTWLHAADYPGSHVVIRNPQRKEIPPTTLLQAAELAAFYSKGNTQPKAAVHYTQKKFVNKPRGSAAGLVSLASFKTILVEPQITAEKVD